MLYLIGVSHKAQASTSGEPETAGQNLYAETLRKTAQALAPVCIAEEFSRKAEEDWQVQSITRRIAHDLEIPHRFCDPSGDERNAIGYVSAAHIQPQLSQQDISLEELLIKARAIEMGKYYFLREKVWLERMQDIIDQDSIFVCGELHLYTFPKLLSSKSIAHEIVAREIGLQGDDWRDMKAVQYLVDHPTILHEGF